LDPKLTVNTALDQALNAIAANVMFAQKIDVWQLSNLGRRKKKLNPTALSAFGDGGFDISGTGSGSNAPAAAATAASPPQSPQKSPQKQQQQQQQQLPLVLVVELVRAFDLPKVRKFGKNNAYAMVKWGGRKMGQSPVVVNSLAPEWNHRLVVRMKQR